MSIDYRESLEDWSMKSPISFYQEESGDPTSDLSMDPHQSKTDGKRSDLGNVDSNFPEEYPAPQKLNPHSRPFDPKSLSKEGDTPLTDLRDFNIMMESQEAENDDDPFTVKQLSIMYKWVEYVKGKKKSEKRWDLQNEIYAYLELCSSMNSSLYLDLQSMLDSDMMDNVSRNICYAGAEGGILQSFEQVDGYLRGVYDMHQHNMRLDYERLRKVNEQAMNHFNTMNTKFESLLQTYSGGADTFKKNLEKFSTIVSSPPAPSFSPSSKGPTGTPSHSVKEQDRGPSMYFKYGTMKVAVVDDQYTVSIEGTKFHNPNLPTYVEEIFRYGNKLNKVTSREVLYQLDPTYFRQALAVDLQWNTPLKAIVQKFMTLNPDKRFSKPMILYA